jgi:hypothetical protein
VKDPTRRLDSRVHGVGVGVGVDVGDSATTLKLTVIEAPLVPVPPVELHGVAINVWVPIALGVHVKSKGVAESVFTMTPSLLNTTLCVYVLAFAVTVQLLPWIRFVPLTNGVPPL